MISLLSLLDDKQMRSTAQLADKMNTSSEMVEAQLERYAQLGYVKKTVMNGSCDGTCKNCKGCNGVKHEEPMVFWEKVMTKKQGEI